MAWIGWIVLIVFIVVATMLTMITLLLLLPFRYVLKARICEHPSVSFGVSVWNVGGFYGEYVDGLWQQTIRICGFTIPLKTDGQEEKPPETNQRDQDPKQKKPRSKTKWKEYLQKARIRSTLALVRDIIRMVGPRVLQIHGRLGFAEPHITSYMLAALGPLNMLGQGVRLLVQPVWDDEYCDLDVELEGRIILMALLARIIRYACSRPMRGLWVGKLRTIGKKLQPFSHRSGIRS